MSSFVNKLANSVTNKSSLLIGRENLAKITNSINKTLFSAKYREFIKAGNTIQLVSKFSHMCVQICCSANDSSRLILYGNGPLGIEHTNSHLTIEIDPKNNHVKFKNLLNYLAFDNEVPCVLAETTKAKPSKHEYIRARNEFRIHEVIGSDEYFSLESCYFPGKYISILKDGGITVTRNKADETTHLSINVIHVLPQYQKNPADFKDNRPIASFGTAAPPPASEVAATASAQTNSDSAASTSSGQQSSMDGGASAKQQESDEAAQLRARQDQEALASSHMVTETPPSYGNLFPTLPPS